jgi:hypothetical protein
MHHAEGSRHFLHTDADAEPGVVLESTVVTLRWWYHAKRSVVKAVVVLVH